MAILIIVVIDQFIDRSESSIVVYWAIVASLLSDIGSRAVVGIHLIRFCQHEEGITPLPQSHHPCICGLHHGFVFVAPFFCCLRIALVLSVPIEFREQAESFDTLHLDGNTDDLICRGQTVLDGDKALIRPILDIAR